MITIKAKLSRLRISPRKVRLVADLIRGLNVVEAERQLTFLPNKSSGPILKLLRSAIANADHEKGLNKGTLKVESIVVEEGAKLKRWRARAMGRAAQIQKKTSHIKIVLSAKEEAVLKPKKKAANTMGPAAESALPRPVDKGEVDKDQTGRGQVGEKKTTSKTYDATAQSKFFSRQPLGGVKKYFRRKSI